MNRETHDEIASHLQSAYDVVDSDHYDLIHAIQAAIDELDRVDVESDEYTLTLTVSLNITVQRGDYGWSVSDTNDINITVDQAEDDQGEYVSTYDLPDGVEDAATERVEGAF
jgi:hypothetical protein